MVNWGTVFVTVTAASYLLGRKELPKIGRFLGLYSGRSVGALIRAKKEFFDATKDNDLLQREFQRGIEELNEIRSELTSVGNMTRPHQPTGSVETDGASGGSNINHAAVGAQGAVMAAVGRGTTAAGSASTSASGVRSSVSLASSADYAMEDGVRRGAEASLAMAELKLAEQGKFVPRVESQEGGADYVSASIMDSLLLERQKPQKTQQPQEAPTSRRTDAP